MRILSALLALSMVVAACGGDDADAPTDTTETTEFVPGTLPDNLLADWYTPETGVVVRFPVDWLPDDEPDLGFLGFTAPPVTGDTFLENFNIVVRDLPAISLAQYAAQDGSALSAANPDLVIVGGYQDVLAGAEATAVVFETSIEGVEVSVLRMISIVDGKGVEFTFVASRHEFENFSPVVQQVIDSIRIEA